MQTCEYLVSIWWHCLSRVSRCGHTRVSVSPGSGIEVSQPCAIPSVLSLLCVYGPRRDPSASFLATTSDG